MRRWILLVIALAASLVLAELQSSWLQSRWLSRLGREISYQVAAGPSDAIRFPKAGPYDERLGYNRLPDMTKSLQARGFGITAQARMSPRMVELADMGLFPAYREKDVAGLTVSDCNARPLYMTHYPERLYDGFESIPPVLAQTLLFIENRDLLDDQTPRQNPAVSWRRFGRVLTEQLLRVALPSRPVQGASTLATQLEKFRHSPGGKTLNRPEKLRQMASASVRAYLDGANTLAARQRIVVNYLNTVPLSAYAGYGEISGLGDGLWAWYRRDFKEVNTLLRQPLAPLPTRQLANQVQAYKEALSLMLAQRAPSHYLRLNPTELQRLTDYHLHLLAEAGVITPVLRDAALRMPLTLQSGALPRPAMSFVNQKAATVARVQLSAMLGVPDLYALDRLDASAATTLNDGLQRVVSESLRQAGTEAGAKAAGMYGHNMLQPGDDPSRLQFSFTLFERGRDANLLRVQTDSVDAPFDINQGARLNLGSTAKLRTVISYLQIITELHQRYADKRADELAHVSLDQQDALSRWVVDYLRGTGDKSLAATLQAALARSYSADPSEGFFTGGGMQYFTNFDPEEDHRSYSVAEGFQHSVNLVYVRLMRDMVRYHMVKLAGTTSQVLADPASRREYLARFADWEGSAFLSRFYHNYRGQPPELMVDKLLETVKPEPTRLAAALRSVEPDANVDRFAERMRQYLPSDKLNGSKLRDLYEKYGTDKYSLADRAYLARVHPLELWLVEYLCRHPQASLSEALAASRDERQQAYSWLLKSSQQARQDGRIKYMLELSAYQEIGRGWRALGYPFSAITPSYASAVGASGDRPAALAELIGIIANGGMRMPVQSLTRLDFAAGTPYETHFAHTPSIPVRALPAELAELIHGLLRDVVNGGTAARINKAYVRADGSVVEVSGKTGTGDQRYEVYAHGGGLIESRRVNRSATFVFMLGDHFYGTITAHVHEPYAEQYSYTSAMTVQLLKSMAPKLMPLLDSANPNRQLACQVEGNPVLASAKP